MGTQAIGIAQLTLRLAFGAVVGYAAFLQSVYSPAFASSGSGGIGESTSPIVLHALMAVAAIWLIFGVRTRVVALFGLSCYATLFWLETQNGFSTRLEFLVPLQIVALLALPLILFGGGHFSLYRAGWRNPL
ncbi:hypothetical protein ACSBLW_04685 [Thioclava sp. FR2]|uniref:hypothetical protein n=1 Tax=Thioclava sp. FR2 TaxID=3445780 RepID=UPI003EBD2CD2